MWVKRGQDDSKWGPRNGGVTHFCLKNNNKIYGTYLRGSKTTPYARDFILGFHHLLLNSILRLPASHVISTFSPPHIFLFTFYIYQ